MSLPPLLSGRLRLPVIGSPMFIVSTPELVIAQCRAGIVGAMPALNARPQDQLDPWLQRIEDALADCQPTAAPYAINQIVHPTNTRLEADLECCIRHRVPIIITSLNPPDRIVDAVHAYGGLVFHDVVNMRHARRAIDAGVDGLVLVCAGAGGHTGLLSPFALIEEVRRVFDGPVVLSGAMTTGRQILAAQVMGADLIYMGTRFIATEEANAPAHYKQMIVDASAADILCTASVTGVTGNYLRPSIAALGLDPDNLPPVDRKKFSFGRGGDEAKAWRDVLSAGQGVGSIDSIEPTSEVVAKLDREYNAACAARTVIVKS
jgi:nitronate monooxygenase